MRKTPSYQPSGSSSAMRENCSASTELAKVLREHLKAAASWADTQFHGKSSKTEPARTRVGWPQLAAKADSGRYRFYAAVRASIAIRFVHDCTGCGERLRLASQDPFAIITPSCMARNCRLVKLSPH